MEQTTEPLTVGDAFEKNVSTFEGHPAEGITNEPDKGGSEGDKKPGESEGDKKPDEGGSKLEFKYASQEAAETAYKAAEKLIGKSTAETKAERERAEALQIELNDLRAQTPVTPKEPEAPKSTSTDKMKDLLDQVNKLDPETEDYHAKVAAIWGQREDAIQSSVDIKVKEALDAYDKKAKEDKDRADAEVNAQKSILSDADAAGVEAGLNMKKGSSDSEMFWAFADKAPKGSIETQIKWTVDKVSGIKAALAAPEKEKEEKEAETARKAKENQEQNSVLERQGEGRRPDKKVPATPLGLADAFKQLQRRI
jgi:hypothetical protein